MNFKDAFQIFLDGFGATTEHDCEENKNRMKAPWTLQDRWLILQKRIDDGIIYALFAQHAIADKDVVDCWNSSQWLHQVCPPATCNCQSSIRNSSYKQMPSADTSPVWTGPSPAFVPHD